MAMGYTPPAAFCNLRQKETLQKAFMAVLSPEEAEFPSFPFLSSQVRFSGFSAQPWGTSSQSVPPNGDTATAMGWQPHRDTSGFQPLELGNEGAELSYKAHNL